MMTNIFLEYVLMAQGCTDSSTDRQSPHGLFLSPVAAELPWACSSLCDLGKDALMDRRKEETKQTVSSDWDSWRYAFCLEGASDLEWQGSQKAGSLEGLIECGFFSFWGAGSPYRLQWTSADGLGVLIISPTRELAYQTFEALRKVGRIMTFQLASSLVERFVFLSLSFFFPSMPYVEYYGSWPEAVEISSKQTG